MRRALPTLFLLGALFPALLLAWPPDDGPERVRYEWPLFHEAVTSTVGEETAGRFLAGWTRTEIDFLRVKMTPLLVLTAPDLPAVPSSDRLNDSFGSQIFGTLGELFGNVKMREWAARDGADFMDELVYARLNPDGNKPDGVLFRIEENRLRILSTLESKMGAQGYDTAQASGFLARWKRHGITVPSPDGARSFDPPSIVMGHEETELPLDAVTLDDLKRISLLVGTRKNDSFPGTYEQLPFDATAAREIARTLIVGLRGNRPHPRRESQRPALVLEGEELENFRQTLRDFLFERGRWPRASGGELEKFLARHVSRRGGQGQVFLQDLDGATRHYLTLFGSIPAINSLANALRRATPETPGALSALRAYIRGFESRRDGDPSPLVASLVATSPAWRDYFATHSVDEFRMADVSEVDACLDAILRAR